MLSKTTFAQEYKKLNKAQKEANNLTSIYKLLIYTYMTTITIPQNLMNEKDLMIVPRSKYERLLAYLKIIGEDENLWRKTSRDNFLKSYNKSDMVYDEI
ncbi:hypothetical protein HYW73_00030 [Candidatus Nomurabacteria bacterium]|nr:hypothetical protein [Candidatus Nomurabacteria bacterium]